MLYLLFIWFIYGLHLSGRKGGGGGFPGWGIICGRTNMRFLYPEAGGISQPQRAAGQPLPFTTEKHTGSGIEPGFPNCEAHAFPRRHCVTTPVVASGSAKEATSC